jgi:hypothetical protein
VTDPNSPEMIDAHRRQELAYRLLLAGATFPQIAATDDPGRPGRKLYASAGAAHDACKRAIKRHTTFEETELAKELAVQRLTAAIRAIWPNVLQRESWAHLRFNEHMQLLARIQGTLAPARSRVEVITRDMIEDEILKLEAELSEERDRELEELAAADGGSA